MNQDGELRLRLLARGEKLPKAPPDRCRVCNEARPPKARSFCGEECRDAYYLVTDSQFLRFKVFERDRGKCAAHGCALDCDELEVRVWGYSMSLRTPKRSNVANALLRPFSERLEMCKALEEHGFRLRPSSPVSLWHADHIEPLVDGGSYKLENVQTLCQPDHHGKTSEEATYRAKRRKLIGSRQIETMTRFRKAKV